MAEPNVEQSEPASSAEFYHEGGAPDPRAQMEARERARQLAIRRQIVAIAERERAAEVSVRHERPRVEGYIARSGAPVPADFKVHSWCGDFVYWVLAQLGNKVPLPDQWQRRAGNVGSNAIGRYFKKFGKTSHPQPGDLYYRPRMLVNGQLQDVNHVGFVVGALYDAGRRRWCLRTINGNAGGKKADWTTWPRGGGEVSGNDDTPLVGHSGDPIVAFMPVLPMIVGESVISPEMRRRYPHQSPGREF